MTYYFMIFMAGLAGSFHCVGMCGGFACALGRDDSHRAATLERHILYNTGRLATYVFIGALAGGLGMVVLRHGVTASFAGGQRILAIASGALMLVMALQFFGFLQGVHRLAAGFGGSTFILSLRSLIAAPGRAAPLAFGVFNGFLPCPLVYAFAAQAAATVDTLQGMLVMFAFGLGTFPAMLVMGGAGAVFGPVWRRRGVWLAGGFLMLIGTITLARGFVPMSGHGVHP